MLSSNFKQPLIVDCQADMEYRISTMYLYTFIQCSMSAVGTNLCISGLYIQIAMSVVGNMTAVQPGITQQSRQCQSLPSNTAPRAKIQQLGNLIFYSCKSKFRRQLASQPTTARASRGQLGDWLLALSPQVWANHRRMCSSQLVAE